ncbi:CTF18 [Candida jiufengensis]|uniref:CTF18 n=1 Tax=Candida jiufengensis TaxID=497108 RepID=UPI002224B68D|nr:CTF18 [Candida jiufengensis]KAI5951070.1 CTF18 [Candida jiufengensis]
MNEVEVNEPSDINLTQSYLFASTNSNEQNDQSSSDTAELEDEISDRQVSEGLLQYNEEEDLSKSDKMEIDLQDNITVKLFNGECVKIRKRGPTSRPETSLKESYSYLDMDSLFAKAELKNRIKDNNKKLSNETKQKSKQSTQLFTEKYKPQNLLSLCPAGNEKQYRLIMKWLNKWSSVVLGEKKNQELEGVDSLGRPFKKILLIHGPPGVGKTVATHILARQLGYNVQELNALNSLDTFPQSNNSGNSNATSNAASALRLKIQNTLTSNSVSKNEKPFCLLIDEIDSLANLNDVMKVLNDVIISDQRATNKSYYHNNNQKDDSKRNKKKNQILNRPIICIANDIYSRPAGRYGPNPLERIRAISEIIAFKKPATAQKMTGVKISGNAMKSIKDYLMKINEKEGLDLDYKDIGEICEVGDGDLRACLNQMQFNGRKSSNSGVTKKSSHSDKNVSWFTMVNDMLRRDPQLKKEEHFARLLDRYTNGNGKVISTNSDLFDKFTNGIFNKYLDVIHTQDDSLNKPCELSDWMSYTDQFSKNFNDTCQYNSIFALKSYLLLSEIRQQKEGNQLIPNASSQAFEMIEALRENRHVTKCVVQNLPIQTQLAIGGVNVDDVATYFLPCITKIINPTFTSKQKSNLNQTELHWLEKITTIIQNFNITLEFQKALESGLQQLLYSPDWDQLSVYENFLANKSCTLDQKQVQLKRQNIFPLVTSEINFRTNQAQALKRPLATVSTKPTESEERILKKKKLMEKDSHFFKTQYDSVKSNLKGSSEKGNDASIKETIPRIWVNFKEGYSNAVRKEVTWNDIWNT